VLPDFNNTGPPPFILGPTNAINVTTQEVRTLLKRRAAMRPVRMHAVQTAFLTFGLAWPGLQVRAVGWIAPDAYTYVVPDGGGVQTHAGRYIR